MDLRRGRWTQEYRSGDGVLIWSQSWTMGETNWNPVRPFDKKQISLHSSQELSATGDVEEGDSSYFNLSQVAAITASLLAVTTTLVIVTR